MLIRDLEEKTGLDRAAIRFYEKEGLIIPKRKENGYREYTEDNLSHLLKIKLLRQLGMSLATIKGLQNGTEDFGAVLMEHIQILEQRIKDSKKAKEVCTLLQHAKARYDTLEAEYYLNLLNQNIPSSNSQSFREYVKRPYHPARRFWARILDYLFITILLEVLFIVIFRVRPYGKFISPMITFATPFVSVLISSILLSKFGVTPGKWLLGLSVCSENGNFLSYNAAYNRECGALKWGFGYGIPIYSTIRLVISAVTYKREDPQWDHFSEYNYHKWAIKRKIALGCVILALCSLRACSVIDLTKPQHLGKLTVEEFADNYNFYYETIAEEHRYYNQMQSDGTWMPLPDTVAEVYVQAQPMYPRQNFIFETNNSNITSIGYENTWTEVSYLTPLPAECKIAAITVIMSQRGMGLLDLYRLATELDLGKLDSAGQLTYNNLQIIWKIDSVNCSYIDGAFRPNAVLDNISDSPGDKAIILEPEDVADTSVSVSWEIKIRN